jgi:hypothetical protein
MATITVQGTQPFTFVHVPKNAGTSIAEWIRATQPAQCITQFYDHERLQDLPQVLGWTFGVVRNPWDRLVSTYHYLPHLNARAMAPSVNTAAAQAWLLKQNGWQAQYPDFEQWIDQYPPQVWASPGQRWTALTGQWEWFHPSVTVLLRYENLVQDFQQIQLRLNCYEPLAHVNTTERLPYQQYYTARTRNLVAQWFEEDIQRYGYEF